MIGENRGVHVGHAAENSSEYQMFQAWKKKVTIELLQKSIGWRMKYQTAKMDEVIEMEDCIAWSH